MSGIVEVDFDAPTPTPITPVVSTTRWSNRRTYILASIGAAVGLGNIWRFPFLCYKNGGASFLVPYLMSLVFLGFPLFVLEFALGQGFQRSATEAFAMFSTRLRGVGCAFFIAPTVIVAYYAVVLAWCCIYIVNCFVKTDDLPWKDNAVAFFKEKVLMDSGSIEETGSLIPANVGALLFIWALSFVCMFKGTRSIKIVSNIAIPLAFVVLIILFIRGVTLPGAMEGIKYYLKPDFSKMFSTPTAWLEACTQIFFSLSLASGNMITYASYNEKRWSVIHSCAVVAIANSATSLFAGAAMFSFLGFKSQQLDIPVSEIVKEAGPGFVFVVVPEALALMPGGSFFSLVFFVMLLMLGLTSAISLAQVGIALIKEELNRRVETEQHVTQFTARAGITEMESEENNRRHERANLLVSRHDYLLPLLMCVLCFLLGLVFVSRGGIEWLALYNHMIDLLLASVGFWEFAYIGWVIGVPQFASLIHNATGWRPSRVWNFLWGVAGPIIMLVLVCVGYVSEMVSPFADAPPWAIFLAYQTLIVPFVVFWVFYWRSKGQDGMTGREYIVSLWQWFSARTYDRCKGVKDNKYFFDVPSQLTVEAENSNL